MNTKSALYSSNVVRTGSVNVSINAMYGHGEASMALIFRPDDFCGLTSGFHGSTAEMRAFAAELIRHADIADAALAQSLEVQA